MFRFFIVACTVLLTASVANGQSAAALSREVNNLRLSQQETEKMIMEQLKRVNAFLVQVQENQTTLVDHITSLNKIIAELQRENSMLKNRLETLETAIAEETKARQAAMDRFATEVARQTANVKASATASPTPAATPAASNSSSDTVPVGSGEFYEYIVERGATLSAISKAYGVSIKDIVDANRLKNHNIFAGQKLYIPVKK
ncbi:MAG: LysM peptidoglycan-binding domain-containing protein [Victivallales bacterium]|nr:LysM peptidoglycan-binding domain-containing protein [Victivallales bacterium]